MKTSTSIVSSGSSIARPTGVTRGSMKVGDLFRNKITGKLYMDTGARTCPPSEGRSTGYTQNGKDIIARQALVVGGGISDGEDGAVMSTDLDKDVIHVGRGAITTNLFRS